MQGFMKIILIIVILTIGSAVLSMMKDSRGSSGVGPVGIILGFALLAGVKAIWNYSSEKTEDTKTTDVEKLDKN